MDSKISEFRERTAIDWAGDETAAAWQKHYPAMKEQFALVTQAIVDAAAVLPGMSVLDLASGTGEPAIPLAQRVAPTGRVMATDLSEGMLNALRYNARAQGVTNIETRVCEGDDLPFDDKSFDRVTSRFGVMFFADIERALAGIRGALKSGGRAAFLVWGAPGPGTYFGTSALPYFKRLAVKPDPDGPGPMRFAERGKLAGLMEAAGFSNVQEWIRNLPAPFRGTPEELLASLFEMAAPLRNAANSLSEEDRKDADDEAIANLRARFDGTVIDLIAPVVIVTGAKL